jgi:hypothetical protein
MVPPLSNRAQAQAGAKTSMPPCSNRAQAQAQARPPPLTKGVPVQTSMMMPPLPNRAQAQAPARPSPTNGTKAPARSTMAPNPAKAQNRPRATDPAEATRAATAMNIANLKVLSRLSRPAPVVCPAACLT